MTGRRWTRGSQALRRMIVLGAQLAFVPMFLAGLEGQQVDIYRCFEASPR